MDWTTKKLCKINKNLSLELDIDNGIIELKSFNGVIPIYSSDVNPLKAALDDSLSYFKKQCSEPIAKPKPSDKISNSHSVDGCIITSVSWDKNMIQLDNSRWIKVSNARDYRKGGTYNA